MLPAVVQLGNLCVQFLVSTPHLMISKIRATSRSIQRVVCLARSEQTCVLSLLQHNDSVQSHCFPSAMCPESESVAFTNIVLECQHFADVIECVPVCKNVEVVATNCIHLLLASVNPYTVRFSRPTTSPSPGALASSRSSMSNSLSDFGRFRFPTVL